MSLSDFGVPYFKGDNADQIWNEACRYLHDNDNVTVSRDLRNGEHVTTRTKETLHATFCIENPRNRVVFSRPINPAFAIAEVLWILAGSKKSDFLSFWNPRMKTWTDDDGTFHGAYGSRLGSKTIQNVVYIEGNSNTVEDLLNYFGPGGTDCMLDQLVTAYRTLSDTPHSRQVVLQIWNSLKDLPHTDNPVSKDVPCNVFADLKVRDGKLHWLQMMRSNDLIWGTPYNFIQWTCVQEIVAGWLGLELGSYTHIASSLHVYEKHWDHLENIASDFIMEHPINDDSLMIRGYPEWNKVFIKVLEIAKYLATTDDDVIMIYGNTDYAIDDLNHKGYENLCWLLLAEALRRKGHKHHANDVIERTSEYWRTSWLNWRDFIDRGKSSHSLQDDQKELK